MPPYLSQFVSSYVCHQITIQIIDAFSKLFMQSAHETNMN